MTRAVDPLEALSRELAVAAGLDPDARLPHPTDDKRSMPVWCSMRDEARRQSTARRQIAAMLDGIALAQGEAYQDALLVILGKHEEQIIQQMRNCMSVGNVMGGVICADGHLGYAQPVGGVIAYRDQISVSGVGFDIACGNMAVRLDMPFHAIKDQMPALLAEISQNVSFGVGRVNNQRVEHALFDDLDAWKACGMEDYRNKALAQLGTVGSGNHYIDLMVETTWLDDPEFGGSIEDCPVWIGVHFGSRGLGHTIATRHLKLGGGKDGVHALPTVFNVASGLGESYLAGMELAGRYAYAGREWVVERVRQIIGGHPTHVVHNHHNYAWKERHAGEDLWVVRKGATPAFPGQQGFIGGSMGDDAFIVEGIDSSVARASFYSTVHGAGRVHGRREAKRRFTREEMNAWLTSRGVTLVGADLDESPMAYRRLSEVLAFHSDSIRVKHRLQPVGVIMAGEGEFDPFKD